MSNTNENEEVQTESKAMMSPFNANDKRIEEDEKELQAMTTPQEDEDDDEKETKNEKKKTVSANDPEDNDLWFKRHGDLRRHAQKKEEEFKLRIEKLEKELTDTKQSVPSLPSTEAEVNEWKKEYPDAYKILATLIKKEREAISEESSEQINELRSQLEAEKQRTAMEKLRAAHPDFDDLRTDQAFHDWVAEQGQVVADVVYGEDSTWESVAREIGVYKKHRDSLTKERKKNDPNEQRAASREAAKEVKTSRGTAPSGNQSGAHILESDIARMGSAEYEQREAEIDTAISEGRIIYDLSDPNGAAAALAALK